MNLKLFFKDVRVAVKRSPVEITLAIICSILQTLYVYGVFKTAGCNDVFSAVLMYTFSYLFISYSFNFYFKSSKNRIFYYLTVLLPLLVFFVSKIEGVELDSPGFIIIFNISSVILALLARKSYDNESYAFNGVTLAKNIVLSVVLMGIANGVISLAYYIICDIFFDNYFYDLGTAISFIILFNVTTLLFLTFEQKNEIQIEKTRFLNILFNYILIPALVLYGVILYIYFLKIVILWNLPKGIVSATAITFIVGGILIKACRFVVDKQILAKLFKNFGLISIPALAMIWVGICYRISEYGFTENRIYLLVTAFMLTIWVLTDIFSKFNNYRYLTIITLVVFNALNIGLESKLLFDESKVINNDNSKNRSKTYNLYSSNKNIDIDGWKKLVRFDYDSSNFYYEIVNDSLNIYHSDKTIFYSIPGEDFFANVFKNSGIDDYTTATNDDFNKIEDNLGIYKDDKILLAISNLCVKMENDKLVLDYINLEYLLLK